MSLLGGEKSNRDVSNPYQLKYVCYGQRLSFFTQKLMAALEWYFPKSHEYKTKNVANGKMLESRSGTHQIPILETPEGWIINDSTPLLMMLDDRLSNPMLYPGNPFTKCVVALIEEYFDEWMARLTIHTRWCDDETARYAAKTLIQSSSSSEIPEETLNSIVNSKASPIVWGRKAIRALGMTSRTQQIEGEKELFRIHSELDRCLRTRRFVLGNAPCAVDAVLVGGLRAHFLNDPYPKKIIQSLSRVKSYALRSHSCTFEKPLSGITEIPEFFDFVLKEMSNGYVHFVTKNRDAIASGKKSFIASVYNESVSYLARPYVEKSRRMLQHHTASFLRNSPKDLDRYLKLLEKYNLSDLYEPQLYSTQSLLSSNL